MKSLQQEKYKNIIIKLEKTKFNSNLSYNFLNYIKPNLENFNLIKNENLKFVLTILNKFLINNKNLLLNKREKETYLLIENFKNYLEEEEEKETILLKKPRLKNNDISYFLIDNIGGNLEKLKYGNNKVVINNQKNFFLLFDLFQDNTKEINKLTSEDRFLINSLITLWKNRNYIFSLDNLYCLMYGKTQKNKINKEKLKELENNLFKLQFTYLKFDIPNSNLKKYIKEKFKNLNLELEGSLINYEKVTFINKNNERETCYKIITAPILLRYLDLTEQRLIATIPSKILNLPRYNKQNERINNFLIQRIISIKNDKNKKLKNLISLYSFFNFFSLDFETMEKRKKYKFKKIIKSRLDFFVKENFIKNYKFQRENIAIFY